MLTKFQFQKGAIKTIIKELQGGVYPPFQFQKGAIKTNPICLPLIQAEYFNSKKVRLRRDGGDAVEAEAEFQFQKGAIKTGGGLPLPGGEPLFQFQKGAIKTGLR